MSKIIKRKYSKSSLDSITESNYEDSNYLGNVITSYDVFYMQNKGINLLKEISINSDFEKDTLITNIIDIHSVFANYFQSDIELQTKLAFQNIEKHSKHSWFADKETRKYNREMFEYFYSDTFKGQAARNRIYSKEFLRDLKTYDSIAKSYIKVIEERLEKK